MYNQGASGVLNEYLQGDDRMYTAHALAIVLLTITFPQHPGSITLATSSL